MDTKFLFFLILSVFTYPTLAEEEVISKPETKSLHDYISTRINADGTSSTVVDYAVTALTEDALEDLKQQEVSFSTSAEKLEILEAYTHKKDGRRVDIPKSNYQLEVNSGKDNKNPAFSDYTTMTVIFPELAVGDTIHLKYRQDQTEALFPNQYSDAGSFSKSRIYEDTRIQFDIPENLGIHYELASLKEKPVQHKDGRKLLEWTFQNKKPIKSEKQKIAVYQFDKQPGYLISTFTNYSEIPKAYGERAKPKAQVTPKIQKLADDLTKGKTTAYDQAKTLYEWVNKNITYAGNCIGVGSVVPRDLDFVLDNRMGDCKDHATLYEALLAAKKIPSTQALINVGDVYELPKTPVVSLVNHVINFIPSLNVYADPTAKGTPFGILPDSEMGKPILLVDGYQEGMKTPNLTADDRKMSMKTKVTITEDGSAKGKIEWVNEGHYAQILNSPQSIEKWNEFMKDKRRVDEYSKDTIKKLGFDGGRVDFTMDVAPKSPTVSKKSADFTVKGFIRLGIAGGIKISPLISSSAISSVISNNRANESVNGKIHCEGGKFYEEYVIEFPKSIKILAVPDNFSAKNELSAYQAEYKLENNILTVKRSYEDNTQGPVCSPDSLSKDKELADKIAPNVEAQIVYK